MEQEYNPLYELQLSNKTNEDLCVDLFGPENTQHAITFKPQSACIGQYMEGQMNSSDNDENVIIFDDENDDDDASDFYKLFDADEYGKINQPNIQGVYTTLWNNYPNQQTMGTPLIVKKDNTFEDDDFEIIVDNTDLILDDKLNYEIDIKIDLGTEDISLRNQFNIMEWKLMPFFEKKQLTILEQLQDQGVQQEKIFKSQKDPDVKFNKVLELRRRLRFCDISSFIMDNAFSFSKPLDLRSMLYGELEHLLREDTTLKQYLDKNNVIDTELTNEIVYILFQYSKDYYEYAIKINSTNVIMEILSDDICALFAPECCLSDTDKENLYIIYLSDNMITHIDLVILYDVLLAQVYEYSILIKRISKLLTNDSNILNSIIISWKHDYQQANTNLLNKLFENNMIYYKLTSTKEFQSYPPKYKAYIEDEYQRSIQNYAGHNLDYLC